MLLFAVMGLVSLALSAWWIFSLVEAIQVPDFLWRETGTSKVVAIVLLALLHWIGAAIYWFALRPKLRGAGARLAPIPSPVGAGTWPSADSRVDSGFTAEGRPAGSSHLGSISVGAIAGFGAALVMTGFGSIFTRMQLNSVAHDIGWAGPDLGQGYIGAGLSLLVVGVGALAMAYRLRCYSTSAPVTIAALVTTSAVFATLTSALLHLAIHVV